MKPWGQPFAGPGGHPEEDFSSAGGAMASQQLTLEEAVDDVTVTVRWKDREFEVDGACVLFRDPPAISKKSLLVA